MSHAKSLRVIGQTLEAAKIPIFEIEKYGPQYMVWSPSVSSSSENWIHKAFRDQTDHCDARQPGAPILCLGAGDILRLDAEGRLRRGNQDSSSTGPEKLVSHGLRTLGDYFDRAEVHAFRIDWTLGSVSVDYQRAGTGRRCASLTFSDLRHLSELAKGKRHEFGLKLLLV